MTINFRENIPSHEPSNPRSTGHTGMLEIRPIITYIFTVQKRMQLLKLTLNRGRKIFYFMPRILEAIECQNCIHKIHNGK